MPQLIEFEGQTHEFPDDFSQEDISRALSEYGSKGQASLPQTSAAGAFGRAALKAPLPAVGGALGWLGAGLLAPETGGLSLLIPAAGALVGGALTNVGQEKAAQALIPGYRQTEAADIQQHPIATMAGNIAGTAPVFEFAPGQAIRGLAQIPSVMRGTATPFAKQAAQTALLQTGLAAAGGAVTPLLEGERPTLGGIAESAATSLLFGNPRWKALMPASMREAARTREELGYASRLRTHEGQVPEGGDVEEVGAGEGGANLEQPAPGQPSGAAQAPQAVAPEERQPGVLLRPLEKPSEPPPKTQADIDYESAERQAMEHAEGQADIVDQLPENSKDPFAGLIATISPEGRIQIDRREFRDWLRSVPVDKRDMAVRSLVAEERNHVITRNVVGEQGAASFWRNLTGFEKYAHSRRYGGAGFREALAGKSDTQLGYEAINSFMQRAARMPMREFLETTGRERWTIKTLDNLANIVFRTREALGTRASREQVELLDRIQANVSGAIAAASQEPGAIRRRGKDDRTPEMFTALHGISGEKGKEVEAAKSARQVEYERPPEEEVGSSYQPFTAMDIRAHAVDHVMKSPVPNFRDLMEDLRKIYGPKLPDAPVLSLFDEVLGKRLDSAPSQYLEAMRVVMGIGKHVGRGGRERSFEEMRRIAEKDRRSPEQIQDQYLSSELAAGNITNENVRDYVKESKDVAKRVEGGQKYRARVISEIYSRIMKEALRQDKPWARTAVNPDEIYYGADSKQPAFQDIYTHMTKFPKMLGRMLTEDSGVDRTGKNAPPVSVTRRVTAIQSKTTGEVFLVSTYRDGRRGPVVLDPTSPGTSQLDMDQMLVRFRPVASALLEDPVQHFYQKFRNLADFDESFANEARHRAQAIESFGPQRIGESLEPPLEREATYLEPHEQFEPTGELQRSPLTGEVMRQLTEQRRGTEFVPRSEVTEGEGGGAVGPQAMPMRAAQGLVRGSMESMAPITAPEALHILNKVYGDEPIESHQDMRAAVDTLTEKSKQGRLDRSDWRFLNALRKIAQSIQSNNPDFTPEQTIERTLNEVFQAAQSSEGREDFAQTIVGRYAQEAPGPLRTAGQSAVERRAAGPTELTMRARVPPTVTRPEQLPPGYRPPERVPPPARPEAIPGQQRPVERLSLEAMARIMAEREGKPPEALQPVKPIAEAKPTGRVTEYTEYGIPRAGDQNAPGAINRRNLRAQWEVEKRKYVAMLKGRETKGELYRTMDGMDNIGRADAFEGGNHIRVQTKDKRVREAAIAMIAVEKMGKDGKYNYQDNFIKQKIAQAKTGIAMAQEWQSRKNPWYWFWGKRWEQAATRWKDAAEYALAHKDDPELLRTVDAFREEMAYAIQHENAHGLDTIERENYAPGYLEGEFWNAGTLRFGGVRGLGGNFKRPKSFDDYFHAISKGPYIPLSFDAADIGQTRISRGRYLVNRRIWAEAGKEMRVPGTQYPLAMEPAPIMKPKRDQLTGEKMFDPNTGAPIMVPEGWKEPVVRETGRLPGEEGPQRVRGEEIRYKLVPIYENGKPIAVHPEYESVFRNALAQSYLRRVPITRDILWGIQVAKHGALLILDTFHVGRLWEYGAASATGKSVQNWYRGGLTALQYRPEDLAMAVNNGYIRQADADWSMQKLEKPFDIKIPRTARFERIETNHDLGRYMVKNGLNTVGTADALWKDAVRNVPGVGEAWHKVVSPLNRWLFDKFTPGLMTQTAINNFKKYQASHPDVPPADLAADVIRDTNAMYGNMGRQGIFKNPTWRDFAQMILLAPVWQEGLLQKEGRFLARLGALPLRAGASAGVVPEKMVPRSGLPAMGVIGESMAKGMLAFAIGTQIINLWSRHKFTWENDEENHKMDAFIPNGDDPSRGVWLSPMSVFAEVMHDMIRYGETNPTTWDSVMQIGENKLGPLGRLGLVLGSRKTSTGEHITSTAGVFKEAGQQMAPLPISLGIGVKAAASTVGLAKPPTPEQYIQRILGAAGFKVQTRERNESLVSRMAKDFMKKEGLQKETGWEEVQTDQPGYTKLRSALRQDDTSGAEKMLDRIRETHNDKEIIRAMMQWEKRPYTGNSKAERLWLAGLDDKELDLYQAALNDRLDTIGKFYDLILQH